MHHNNYLIFFFGLTFFVSSLGLAGDGTLPLGAGTLPLKLAGKAVASTDSQQENAFVVINSVASQDSTTASFSCKSGNTNKRSSSGTVTVGGSSFSIEGLCYQPNSNALEVVATSANVVGNVSNNQAHTQYTGRILINGSSHYNVQLQSISR